MACTIANGVPSQRCSPIYRLASCGGGDGWHPSPPVRFLSAAVVGCSSSSFPRICQTSFICIPPLCTYPFVGFAGRTCCWFLPALADQRNADPLQQLRSLRMFHHMHGWHGDYLVEHKVRPNQEQVDGPTVDHRL